MTMGEYRDLIPAFKDFYYEARLANPKATTTSIMKGFNEQINDEGREFYPYTSTIRNWRKKWDKDILEKKGMQLEVVRAKRRTQQVVKSRAAEGEGKDIVYHAPAYEDLEMGVQSMAGELMNDAFKMMRDDQDLEDIYETDELIKRKNHVLNVFSHVTKMVQGKAAIMLKASEDKRENANFLMNMMKKSTSGEMSLDDIQTLRSSFSTPQPVESVTVHE